MTGTGRRRTRPSAMRPPGQWHVCLWHIPIAEWSRLQHMLHGNGAVVREAKEADAEDGLGLDGTEDDMLELDVQVDGLYRTIPVQILWRSEDGAAAAALCRSSRSSRLPPRSALLLLLRPPRRSPSPSPSPS